MLFADVVAIITCLLTTCQLCEDSDRHTKIMATLKEIKTQTKPKLEVMKD